jgi:Amt family ammonium transporter
MGISYGLISSLVAVTPSAGYLGLRAPIFVGVSASLVCFYSIHVMNKLFKRDDPLEVFTSHGVAGLLGALLTPFLADPIRLNASGVQFDSIRSMFLANLISGLIVIAYSATVSLLLIFALKRWAPLRATARQEELGLDLSFHGEKMRNS